MKMVVMDLDGTLLRSDRTISARTLHILRQLHQHGIQIVVATARPPRQAVNLSFKP